MSLGLRQRTNSRPTAAAGRDFDVVTAYGAMAIFLMKEYFLSLSQGQRLLVPQVVALLQFILIIPQRTERSFSALRLLKSYLCTTTIQERLNYLMLLDVVAYPGFFWLPGNPPPPPPGQDFCSIRVLIQYWHRPSPATQI